MNSESSLLVPDIRLSRRRFVQGVAAAAALGGAGLWKNSAQALAWPGGQPALFGTEFDLEVGALPVDSPVTGAWRPRSTVWCRDRSCGCVKARP